MATLVEEYGLDPGHIVVIRRLGAESARDKADLAEAKRGGYDRPWWTSVADFVVRSHNVEVKTLSQGQMRFSDKWSEGLKTKMAGREDLYDLYQESKKLSMAQALAKEVDGDLDGSSPPRKLKIGGAPKGKPKPRFTFNE